MGVYMSIESIEPKRPFQIDTSYINQGKPSKRLSLSKKVDRSRTRLEQMPEVINKPIERVRVSLAEDEKTTYVASKIRQNTNDQKVMQPFLERLYKKSGKIPLNELSKAFNQELRRFYPEKGDSHMSYQFVTQTFFETLGDLFLEVQNMQLTAKEATWLFPERFAKKINENNYITSNEKRISSSLAIPLEKILISVMETTLFNQLLERFFAVK